MSDLIYAGLHHVKFPVTDLDASLQWYETVLKAKREPRFDHLDADGKRFADPLEAGWDQIDGEVRR